MTVMQKKGCFLAAQDEKGNHQSKQSRQLRRPERGRCCLSTCCAVARGGGVVACGDSAARSALSEASGRCEVAGRLSQQRAFGRILPDFPQKPLPVGLLRSGRVDLTSGEKNPPVLLPRCQRPGMGVGGVFYEAPTCFPRDSELQLL